ncbi:hypothetical protein [Actinomadura rugatobispora]|uniref:Lipoprotein n=1 Tax=Actinomadura rugatobispora TaxID=1994 RepID=A0ABW1AHR7_9ACTN|nr:hypothetical protein GCM10010200_021430 [Actinomadura rugatobispora]
MTGNTGRFRGVAVPFAVGLSAFALLTSACGSSGDDKPKSVAVAPGGSAAPSQSGNGGEKMPSDKEIYAGLLKYSQCMRSHGVSNFPDPVPGKGLQVNGNAVGANSATTKAAEKACQSLMPAGGSGDNPAQDRARALKHSKCMRDHGVTRFPDPNPNGGAALDGDKIGMAPDHPVYQAAEKACQKYAGGDTHGSSAG